MLRGECSLGLFDLSSQLLHGSVVLSEILSGLFLVHLDEVLHGSLIKVLSSEMGVSIGGQHLKGRI